MLPYQFTIIVPVYNEEENLDRVEKELLAFTKIATKKTSILFVNDGSKDNSQALIEDICQRNEAFHFINFKENCGLSAAIKAGFDHVETPLLGYIDSDLQTAPEDFNLLLERIGEYDLVTGVRANRKDKFVKNMSSKIANSIRRAFTNDGMDDTATAAAGSVDGKAVYENVCVACHAGAIPGIPKLGDKADWEPRIAQGNDVLYDHAINGFMGAAMLMPPKGGADISDEEVKAAVDYMVENSQ